MTENRAVLLTGGAGFFGGILKRELLAQGTTCVSVDLQPDDHHHPNLVSVQGDIRDRELLMRIFASHRFDTVFHCAAMLAHDIPDRAALWQSNVEGTRNIAHVAAENGVSRIVFTSSNCIWGRSFARPVREDDPPDPVEIYGHSKWEAEKILQSYAHKFNVVILRCPTIIDSGRLGLLAILFEFIDEGRTIWTVGAGENCYQFVFAPDLADACLRATRVRGTRVFNVGSDNVEPLHAVYQYVIEHAGTGAKVRPLPKAPTLLAMRLAHGLRLSPLGPYQYKMIAEDFQFDTRRIKAELGWQPTLNNSEMLLRAYQYFRQHREEIVQRRHASSHRRPAQMGIIRLVKWLS
jgi:nucleoside-diphosphate-sugar epimerase